MRHHGGATTAPGPLADYARRYDDGWGTLAQRQGFRRYLQGLLLPRDRNKTLTGLAGTEPVVGALAAVAQALQYSLPDSRGRRGAPQAATGAAAERPATRPHDGGVLVLDDTGDRKAGT